MFSPSGYQPQSFVESIVASRLGVNSVNPIEASVAQSLETENQQNRIGIVKAIKDLETQHSLTEAEKEWIMNGNRASRR
ncbi:hypothetical protein SEA_ARAXXI_26 [Microbacterium phage Araxxi]|uniref:Uncharacterized protein n=1 Tax=Microbacterium phage Araxxi TaxID=2590948 RepID=A0A516KT34_9CAUD|nr:hypothetical protein HWC57_gp26 [Microbacterium phage Araxxi]QDP44845.1 hypothetical protein SEA_ARAXXI_26 [Microbacterium phage Araxxi]USH45473.1 hypothetical protein SEA_DOTI_26 [Microbacterium phage DoTi]